MLKFVNFLRHPALRATCTFTLTMKLALCCARRFTLEKIGGDKRARISFNNVYFRPHNYPE